MSAPVDGRRRRAALARGLDLLAGAVVTRAFTRDAQAEGAKKLDRAAVQYVDVGPSPGKDCDDCVQFIPGAKPGGAGTCRIVEGPISPHGHCIAFSPKPRAARKTGGISAADPRFMT